MFTVELIRKAQHLMNDKRIAANTGKYVIEEKCNINYMGDSNDYHLLDVYSPKDIEGKLPVIVEIHGGAYISCYKEVNKHHSQWFASHGYRVVNINYTLYPEADYRTVMKECFAVFDWIKTNCDKYGFDENNIFVTGDSAGGHLAMVLAACQNCKRSQEYFCIIPYEQGIRAFAVSCPISGFDGFKDSTVRLMKNLMGKAFEDREYIKNISYKFYADENYPEIFIVTTPTDKIFYSHTKKLHDELDEMKIKHQYKEYTSNSEKKLDHVFNVLYPDLKESVKANTDILKFFESKKI